MERHLSDLYAEAVDFATAIVDRIEDERWHDPTPCVGWDVHTVVNHLTNESLWVEPLVVDGMTIEDVGHRYDGDLLGDDPKTAFRSATAMAVAAFSSPGAMDRKVALSFGMADGATYCSQMFTDMLIHGWDIAQGAGVDAHMPERLAENALQIIEPDADDLRAAGLFGPAVTVPVEAGPELALLGVAGRGLNWRRKAR